MHNVGPIGPAALGKALCRQYLVYPLASFDISGQQPLFVQTPHANEDLRNYYLHSFRELSTDMLDTYPESAASSCHQAKSVMRNCEARGSRKIEPCKKLFEGVTRALSCPVSRYRKYCHARLPPVYASVFEKNCYILRPSSIIPLLNLPHLAEGCYVSKTFRHEKTAFLDCARPALPLHE